MIGRLEEIKVLRKAFESEKSEFVMVYGRRRVGKTFLVNEVLGSVFSFRHAGIEKGTKKEQLYSFRDALVRQGHTKCPKLADWFQAFSELETFLESLKSGRKVIFIDEMPWYDTPKSRFLKAFESFWNGWAVFRKDILLVACGSATSWIVKKVFRNRGGLHNRVTRQLPVMPFTLAECEQYAKYRHLEFDRRQIAECYMAFGGVAYYWTLLEEGLSAAQNFDKLFFGARDEMRNEYDRMFASLFGNADKHVSIVEVLVKKRAGMTREEIIEALGVKSGGYVSGCLRELEECGFVRHYNTPGSAKKGAIFQLMDSYVAFYFQFLKGRSMSDPHFWTHSYAEPRLNAWRGLAFERLCFMHVEQIKHALDIAGMRTDVFAWRGGGSAAGSAQVDMVIDRADRIVNLCEIKFSGGTYELDKNEYEKIERRVEVFRAETGTKKGIMKTMITFAGVKEGKYRGNIQSEVTLDDLFRE